MAKVQEKKEGSSFSAACQKLKLTSTKKLTLMVDLVKEPIQVPNKIRFYPSVFLQISGGYVTMKEMFVTYRPAFVHVNGSVTFSIKDSRFSGEKNLVASLTFPTNCAVIFCLSDFPYSPVKSGSVFSYEWEIESTDLNHGASAGQLEMRPTFGYLKDLPAARPITLRLLKEKTILAEVGTNKFKISSI